MAAEKSRISRLNHFMLIDRPAVEGKGEDAYAYHFDDTYAMMGVFDGCGGLGARKYENYHNATGAYIAARVASAVTLEWFEECLPCDQTGMYQNEKKISGSLKNSLDEALALTKENLDTASFSLRGGMIKSFPTTMSAVVMDYADPQRLKCLFMWAGDSRGYILRPDGLRQCTKDDLRIEEDAFENLYADSPLSNMVNAETDYDINVRRISCVMPTIVLTATDGAFGYLPSPMHFERMILDALMNADSPEEWKNRLHASIGQVTADDSAMMMAIFGWKDFRHIRQAFSARYEYLNDLLKNRESADALREAWQTYKERYEFKPSKKAE